MPYRTVLLLFIALASPLHAAGPATPPMAQLVAECRQQGFVDAVCNPAPSAPAALGPIIAFADAHLANGNTGTLWLTAASVSFQSNLNDERVLLFTFTMTSICSDLTTVATNDASREHAAKEAHRNYFRITTPKAALTFWVPGGREDLNNAARFYQHALSTILPVETCTLRAGTP